MKSAVLVVLLLAVALAAIYFVFSKPAYPVSEADAKRFFLEDLQEKYPTAEVREIVEIIPSTAQDGSLYYSLKARVTSGLSSPCPERVHVFYDYPPKNFVAQPPEYITRGCKVCLNEPVCILAFPEEAIIASHTYGGAEAVAQFVKSNSDATSIATYYENYGEGYTGVWVVTWSSDSASTGYRVILSKGANKVISAEPISLS